MAEIVASGIEVAGLALAVFPRLIQIFEAQVRLINNSKGMITNRSTLALKTLELDLQVGYQKFKIWHENWLGQKDQSGQKDQPDASSKALWGAEGWDHIQGMLKIILHTSQQIERAYKNGQAQADSRPRSRWKLALTRLKKTPEPSFAELRGLVKDLNLAVDAIWLYSETVFDSLHGVIAPGLLPPMRDVLLTSALQSRSGSLELYKLCCKGSTDCTLELDLKPDTSSGVRPFENDEPSRLSYQLFAQTSNDSTQLRKLLVENSPIKESFGTKSLDILGREDSDFQLFKIKPSVESIIIPVEREGANASSCLLIEKPSLEDVQLTSEPETLGKILKRLKGTNLLSPEEHFSVGAKVELAYKIVESGIFLLGTPWLSLLNSQHLLRLKDANRKRPSFVLEVQTIGLVDLLYDDSEALSETRQLYHIGVLLMEIALDGPIPDRHTKEGTRTTTLLSQLPLVERAMGAQYCKATAFCLQHRQTRQRFNGLGKYESSYSKDWEAYLSNLLQDYYSQVFLRLEELREIDTNSDYRSRKSWLIEE